MTPTHRYRFVGFPQMTVGWDPDHELYWRALGTWIDQQPREEETNVEREDPYW